jgi:hypothetical protein
MPQVQHPVVYENPNSSSTQFNVKSKMDNTCQNNFSSQNREFAGKNPSFGGTLNFLC